MEESSRCAAADFGGGEGEREREERDERESKIIFAIVTIVTIVTIIHQYSSAVYSIHTDTYTNIPIHPNPNPNPIPKLIPIPISIQNHPLGSPRILPSQPSQP